MKLDHRGWVPCRFAYQQGGVYIDWCHVGNRRLNEPFFDNSVEIAQRQPFNHLFHHRTPVSELEAWRDASPGLEPSGFIFHMSRCGSTLITQMLAALPDTVVVSEAAPLDHLARATWVPEELKTAWLRGMVSALGQRRTGAETRFFVKFDSVTSLAIPSIRRAFPNVPWIFLHRDAEEVLVSNMRRPAPAMACGIVTDFQALDSPAEEIAAMGPEEYAARVVGRVCEHAARALPDGGLAAPYTRLPEALWEEIARHFGIGFSGTEVDALRAAAQFSAKEPGAAFQSDSEGKKREVTEEIREAAARWIEPFRKGLDREGIPLPPGPVC